LAKKEKCFMALVICGVGPARATPQKQRHPLFSFFAKYLYKISMAIPVKSRPP
jgi:hypothetical protein